MQQNCTWYVVDLNGAICDPKIVRDRLCENHPSPCGEVVLLWFLGRLTCCLRWGRKSKWVCLMHDGFAKCRPWGRWKFLRDAKVSMEEPVMMQWLLAQWIPTRQWEHERHLDNKKSGSILRRWNCQMSRATHQRSWIVHYISTFNSSI